MSVPPIPPVVPGPSPSPDPPTPPVPPDPGPPPDPPTPPTPPGPDPDPKPPSNGGGSTKSNRNYYAEQMAWYRGVSCFLNDPRDTAPLPSVIEDRNYTANDIFGTTSTKPVLRLGKGKQTLA